MNHIFTTITAVTLLLGTTGVFFTSSGAIAKSIIISEHTRDFAKLEKNLAEIESITENLNTITQEIEPETPLTQNQEKELKQAINQLEIEHIRLEQTILNHANDHSVDITQVDSPFQRTFYKAPFVTHHTSALTQAGNLILLEDSLTQNQKDIIQNRTTTLHEKIEEIFTLVKEVE